MNGFNARKEANMNKTLLIAIPSYPIPYPPYPTIQLPEKCGGQSRKTKLNIRIEKKRGGAKISIRNIRRKTNDEVKKLKDGGVPEDETKKAETSIQKTTDEFIAKVDQFYGFKEKEIMTI